MAYATLDELLKAYQLQNQGAGPVIQAGTQGLMQGANLASTISQKQAMDQYRKQLLAEKIKEATANIGIKQEQADTSKAKEEKPAEDYSVAAGVTAPEGKVAVIQKSTGKIHYEDAPGAKSGKDVTSGIADARIKMSLSNSLLQDPQYRKNQDIIDRGLRIENIATKKDIVDNPAALHILNDLIVAQAEGGKASVAGVSKVQNETASQFAARVIEKITNEPESTKADSFIKQIKGISQQDMKSAYTSIKSLARAKANGLQRIYPDKTQAIKDVADNFADDYIDGLYGGKKPSFLNETAPSSDSTPATSRAKVNTADDFLKKHGISAK